MSKVRTLEDVIKEYNEVSKDSTMYSDPNNPDICRFKNHDKRNRLQKEYNLLLPENQKMAIFLHDMLCHKDHTDQCGWYYEIDGIVHNWTRYNHKIYLEKADKLIQCGININIIRTIFECIK